MSSFQCSFCERIVSTRNGLSKHMAKCIHKIADEDLIIPKCSEYISMESIDYEDSLDNFNFNEDNLHIGSSSKKISFKNINFHSTLKSSKHVDFGKNHNLEMYAGPPNLSNIEESSKYLEDMSFELDNSNSPNEFENILQEYNNPSEKISVDTEIFKDQYNSSDEEVNPKYNNFPNEAYADLMVLVTKHKLSNTAGNAIISFFNKHSNHTISPLPKNIKQGKLFMNNMESNLSYKKTTVLKHNNTEYFLYHMPLISCIKNILEIPNISQTFALEYEELYKTTEVQFLILFLKVKNV